MQENWQAIQLTKLDTQSFEIFGYDIEYNIKEFQRWGANN